MAMWRGFVVIGAVAAAFGAQPALADVKAGVDAWSRGEYTTAVREWQVPAEAGNPDALFNLAQAYRLGRGVPADEARAETYYAQAAAKGHLQAADTYGLMLFQSGRREIALPYVEDAARRGDPRSQYLLGVAHFNGDMVARDWVKAYALVTLANSAGLPQAAPALAQMDASIPLEERQQAAALAAEMRAEADAARGRELAAAELAFGATVAPASPPPLAPPSSSRVPQPIPQVAVSPSITAARAAVAEASRVAGTASPAEAGADFARPAAPTTPPPVVAASAPAPRQVAGRTSTPPAAAATVPAPTSDGRWRVQLGAFAVPDNADKLWARLSGRAELAGRNKLKIPAGRVTKLQAGGFSTQAQAESACRALKSSGQDCLVTTR
jgi:cell division septation protein DedD